MSWEVILNQFHGGLNLTATDVHERRRLAIDECLAERTVYGITSYD